MTATREKAATARELGNPEGVSLSKGSGSDAHRSTGSAPAKISKPRLRSKVLRLKPAATRASSGILCEESRSGLVPGRQPVEHSKNTG